MLLYDENYEIPEEKVPEPSPHEKIEPSNPFCGVLVELSHLEILEKSVLDLDFLQAQLKLRKAQLKNAFIQKNASISTPVMDLSNRKCLSDTPTLMKPIRAARTIGGDLNVVPKSMKKDVAYNPVLKHDAVLFGEVLIKDEYDPTRPTNYDGYKKEKREAQIAKVRQAAEVAARLHREKLEHEAKELAGVVIGPVNPFLMDVENEPPLESCILPKKESRTELIPKKDHGLSIAASIMAKMGYKEGYGLGKSEQGVTTALKVERRGKGAGLIVQETVETPPKLEVTIENQNHTPAIGPILPPKLKKRTWWDKNVMSSGDTTLRNEFNQSTTSEFFPLIQQSQELEFRQRKAIQFAENRRKFVQPHLSSTLKGDSKKSSKGACVPPPTSLLRTDTYVAKQERPSISGVKNRSGFQKNEDDPRTKS